MISDALLQVFLFLCTSQEVIHLLQFDEDSKILLQKTLRFLSVLTCFLNSFFTVRMYAD